MSLLDRLQRWVAIIETISDKRAETLVTEIRDAIEEMRAGDPDTYLASAHEYDLIALPTIHSNSDN